MYNHKEIEKKWQKYWKENKTFKVKNDFSKPKYYALDMFPYPSSAGLHVGHPKGYVGSDIFSRYKKAKGFNVLHPMGWDAFGLPAENYAIKTGTHPRITTDKNIENYKKQLSAFGFSYDWDREVDTTDPKYYKWTQWIFLKLFEKGLAYEQDLPINYCPSCKTGLANEEVLNDFSCDRCGTKVEKKKLRQWVLAITKYAERLLNDVDKLDWPEGIKDMQRNWIGKSEGCEFEMKLAQKKGELPLHNVGGLNVLAKFSSISSILGKGLKVKSKIKFFGKIDIKGVIERGDFNINFNSKNLLKHFKDKRFKEFNYRRKLLPTVFSIIDNINFDENGIGYFIYKTLVIKVVLGKQKNGNYLIKTFYKHDSYTILYRKYLQELDKNISKISVYTTRIDTVFGMTYAVLAPDHPSVNVFITEKQKSDCEAYIENSNKMSDQDRTADNKEKTGVFTGSYVVNPFNGKEVPLWIGDYVLGNYGTGAVMAVPAHDTRDFEFAKKYGLDIEQSIAKYILATGVNAPKKGKEDKKREFINAIIEYNGKFLLLKEKVGCKFVGGGLENNESILDGIKREILEETGFTDFGKINTVLNSAYYGYAYRHTHDRNDKGFDYPFFHIKLNSLKQEEISEKEKAIHDLIWVEKNEVKGLLFSDGHKYPWECFLKEKAFTDYGILINSGDFTGLSSKEAKTKLAKFAEEKGFGTKKVNYKLRDWLFSRQRYWGEPIPLIHLDMDDLKTLEHISSLEEARDKNKAYILKRAEKDGESCTGAKYPCGSVRELVINGKVFSKIYDGIYGKTVCDYRLPLELPEMQDFAPAGDGNSPLAKVDDFVNVKLAENLNGKRETNTMPQWGGSCWYYLRYMDPDNKDMLVDPEAEKYWGQVDSYVGGAEHAVLHLLYARFWHKFLFDIGVVSSEEPFYRLRNQGLIQAFAYKRKNGGLVANDLVEEKDGKYFEISSGEELDKIVAKMSKSLKNVVNPDEIIEEFGADSLRLYEMYMAEFKDSAPWDSKGIIGVRRFLEKVERAFSSIEAKIAEDDNQAIKLLHKTIKKVEEDIENYKFNTAIASMMILVNYGRPKDEELFENWKYDFIKILSPFAPHIAEELFEKYSKHGGKGKSVFYLDWPEYDENLIADDSIKIGVQVLGKLRGEIEISKDESKESVLEKAKNNEDVKKWLEGKNIVKEIYVPGKIVNLVVK